MTAVWARAIGLGLAAWVAAFSLAAAAPAFLPPTTGDDSRQILVMLRLPPQHAQPNGGYGGSYGDGAGRAARMRVAGRIARAYGVAVVSEWPMPLLGVDCFVMTVPEGQTPEELSGRLSKEPGVSWSEPVHLFRGRGEPLVHNDSLYRAQPAAAEWRLADLHRIATGRNVHIAVIDSAIDRSHPDLAGQIELSENFLTDRPEVPETHGTGVAGIIAARADNGIGIAGVAPRARLMGLRACWQESGRGGGTVCDSLSLARALDFAIGHKAQIINLSLSGPQDQLLGKLLDVALARDVIIVGAYDHSSGVYAGASGLVGYIRGDGIRTLGYTGYVGYARRTDSGLTWDVGASTSRITVPARVNVPAGVVYPYAYTYTRRYRAAYTEAYVGVSRGDLSAHVYVSPDYLGEGVKTAYLDLNAAVRPASRIRLTAHAGALTALDGRFGRFGSGGRRTRFDLRAGAVFELPHGELQLAWTGASNAEYPRGYPQKRSAVVVSASAFF